MSTDEQDQDYSSARAGYDSYRQLGRDISQASQEYADQLQHENFPPPSTLPHHTHPIAASDNILKHREKLLKLCQQLLSLTMDPATSLLISSLQYHFCSCLKIAVDLRVADHIPGNGTTSIAKLAEATGAEEALLVRIMRVLTAKDVFAQPQVGFYGHTAISWYMRITPHIRELLCHRLHEGFRSACHEPEALRQSGYREPSRHDLTGFNSAFQTRKSFWEYTWSSEIRSQSFYRAMKAVPVNSVQEVACLYPFADLARHGGLIVDVGGGLGQLSEEILRRHPDNGLRCIVQDLGIDSDRPHHHQDVPGITYEQHDFFRPQPVRGAAAYLLRHILHDWSDDLCIEILRRTASAMDKERSCMLIIDQVMQAEPTPVSVLYDVDMMALFGGKERNLAEVMALVSKADARLHVRRTHQSCDSMNTVIELHL